MENNFEIHLGISSVSYMHNMLSQIVFIDGVWSQWTDWDSECEKSDDSNIWKKSRTRTCTEPEPKYNGLQCCFNRKDYAGNDILREVDIENETKCQEKCSENIGKKNT